MQQSKFGKYVLFGALAGALVSLFDRNTREQVMRTSKNLAADVRFYSKNPDILKTKVQEKAEKFQSVYEQLSGDANYLKSKVEEIKTLTPQVKELVTDTKEAFVQSKDEYKSIVQDDNGSPSTPLQ